MGPFDIPERNRLRESAHQHVTARNALLPSPEDSIAQANDQAILTSSVEGIVDGIRERRWTASEVLQAFIRSATRAQGRTNCLTAVAFDRAITRAAELDSHFARTNQLLGPLHGVPISFKEHYHLKSTLITLGFTSWLSHPPSSEDGIYAIIAESLGAVPFVKTNIPQTMLAFECNNPVWGRTTNPYSPHHTSGGSSGGEGALLAQNGSALGFGSDIGGSLRIPAGYCGIYALKPSAGRWTKEGSVGFAGGFEGVLTTTGPMARSVGDLEVFFRTVTGRLDEVRDGGSGARVEGGLSYEQKKELRKAIHSQGYVSQPVDEGWFDPLAVTKSQSRPLRIGYCLSDGFIKTSPACYRAINESVAALRAKYPGKEVELVRVKLGRGIDGVEGMRIFTGLTSSDGYDRLTSPHLGKDRPDPTLFLPLLAARIPALLRWVIVWILAKVVGDGLMAMVLSGAGRKSAKRYFGLVEEREEMRREWVRRVWEEYELDAILMPVQASPAIPHNAAAKLSLLCSPCVLFNVLNYPSAVLPVTRVSPLLDDHRSGTSREYAEWKAEEEVGGEFWGGRMSRMVGFGLYEDGGGVYSAEGMEGLPVGVQVVTRPFQEEKAIGIMRLLDAALPPIEERGGTWRDYKTGEEKVGLGKKNFA